MLFKLVFLAIVVIPFSLSSFFSSSAKSYCSLRFRKFPACTPPPSLSLYNRAKLSLFKKFPISCCVPDLGLAVFAQQWAPGYGPMNKFTIHGLWPDFCDKKHGPANGCDPSRKYPNVTIFLDNKLKDKLEEIYPSYIKGNHSRFWSHEWGKHGTCLSTLSPECYNRDNYRTGSEVAEYFELNVKLHKQLDVYQALEKAGIKPKGYTRNPEEKDLIPLKTVDRALRKAFGVRSQLTCIGTRLFHVMTLLKAVGRTDYLPIENEDRHLCPRMIRFPLKFPFMAPPSFKQPSSEQSPNY